jgi:hypothetical protein
MVAAGFDCCSYVQSILTADSRQPSLPQQQLLRWGTPGRLLQQQHWWQ